MTETEEIVLRKGWGRTNRDQGSVLFVGTATTIIRYAGFTILTDPNFLHRGEQVRLGYGLRSTRQTDPSMDIADLPALDLVILSHMHEDHFDRVAEQNLDKTVPIVTTPHAANALTGMGFLAPRALETWDTVTFRKGDIQLRITAMPGQHGSHFVSKLLPPVMGSMVEFQAGNGNLLTRMYISGDTLVFNQLREIPRRFPNVDLALVHLGGTRVFGLLLTMDGKQGVEAIKLIAPQIAIPIHYNDYPVMKSPLEDFQRHVKEAGLEDRVRYLSHGETYRWRVPKSRR